MKAKAMEYTKEKPAPMTADFVENGQGVFVPQGISEPPKQEGSTVKVDAKARNTTA